MATELSSGSESETERIRPIKTETPQQQVSEPVPLPPKKKKALSERQLEILRQGRAKKLAMNQKAKEGKKKNVEEILEDKKEEASPPSTPAPAAEDKKEKKKKRPLPPQRPPSPASSSSYLSSSDRDSDSDLEDLKRDARVQRMVDRYLTTKARGISKKKVKTEAPPRAPPALKRSSYDDFLFV
jgi:hypothetical protein